MTVEIESEFTIPILRERIISLYQHRHWSAFPKGFTGDVKATHFEIAIENGLTFWVGRGKFKGQIVEIEQGSLIVGNLNSSLKAVLFPTIICLFFMAGMPGHWIRILIFGCIFSIIGVLVAKSDHSQLIEAMQNVANK